MFDPNVSDPLVIEHGTEQYGVTVPMEMVLKTALYSDIAHMRVKHAPEAVPSAPRPEVYYAPGDELEDDLLLKASCGQIIGTDLDKSPSSQLSQSKTDVTSDILVESKTDATSDTLVETKTDVTSETLVQDNSNASVEQIESIEKIDSNDSTNQESDQIQSASNEPIVDLSSNDNKDEDKDEDKDKDEGKTRDQTSDEHKFPEEEIPDEKTLETVEIESTEEKIEKENEEVINENDKKDEQQSDSNEKETEKTSKPENPVYNKMTLGIRHSVPETTLHERKSTSTLVTAISAEDSASVDKRRSAQGESRREQMLKRLSNPVDKIGNLTKSGISSGISATKTGFNKVLATPKNIVEFSSGLVRDAKDALSSGSKGDSLESDLEVFSKGTANSDSKKHLSIHGSDNRQSSIGYQNMVDTKIDVFANFESMSFKTS
jgi:hypothetical protein